MDSVTTDRFQGFVVSELATRHLELSVFSHRLTPPSTIAANLPLLTPGRFVTATAQRQGNGFTISVVEDDDFVTGRIDAIDRVNSEITILNHRVRIDGRTQFDPAYSPSSLDGLSVGAVVRVNGEYDNDRVIVAGRIESANFRPSTSFPAAVTPFQIIDVAQNVDLTARTLSFGQLPVNFAGARGISGRYDPSNGDFAGFRGAAFTQGATFVADFIRDSRLIPGGRVGFGGNSGIVEGPIRSFASSASFVVSEVPITTSASTIYVNGTAGDLVPNARIRVEGTVTGTTVEQFNANTSVRNNAIAASRITFQPAANVAAAGPVSLGATARTLTVAHNDFAITDDTIFEDQSAIRDQVFELGDVRGGDFLQIAAYPGATGLVAVSVRRETAGSSPRLRGFAQNVTATSFVLLGLTVSADSTAQFFDLNGNSISQAAFFTLLRAGDIVAVTGLPTTPTTFGATRLALATRYR